MSSMTTLVSDVDTIVEPAPQPRPWTHYRARIASLTRSRLPDDPDLVEARRLLALARLASTAEASRI